MIKNLAIWLAIVMLALVAWGLFFGTGTHIVIDGQEITGPLKGVVGTSGLIVAMIALFCAAIFLAFVFAGVGLFILGIVILVVLVVAGISLPFLLILLIPLAIVWGFIALIKPKV
jgi:hypothetical protein